MPFPLLFAATSLANGINGFVQQQDARKGLNSLVKPQGYNVTQEQNASYTNAQHNAMNGYSPQERAAYLSSLAQRNNAGYSKAMKFGGNGLAGAIQAGVNYGNASALNNFASQDAGLRRSNIRYADSRGDVISQQKNRQTQLENNNYNQKQAAFGNAIKTGKENMWNSANLFSALTLGGGGILGGSGQTAGSSLTTAPVDNSLPQADTGNGGGDGGYMGMPLEQGQVPSADAGMNPSYQGNIWGSNMAYGAAAPNYGMKYLPPLHR